MEAIDLEHKRAAFLSKPAYLAGTSRSVGRGWPSRPLPTRSAKNVNKKLAIWRKGIIQDRVEFKALEGGSLHKQDNPACGSQPCPVCGFRWYLNRKGDRVRCPMCEHEAPSDKVAAINYFHKADDEKMTLFIPYVRIREVLMERFLRRLECNNSIALPSGLKPETVAYIKRGMGIPFSQVGRA